MPSLAIKNDATSTSSDWRGIDLDARLLDTIGQLKGLGAASSAESLDRLRQGLEDPATRIAVFGEFNRGKSTLINALLGRSVLPSSLVPTTGHVTYVVGRDEEDGEDVLLHRPGGDVEQVDWDELQESVAFDDQGLVPEDVERVEVRVDIDWLRRGVAFIDTPGVNDDDKLTQRAKQAIVLADVVLLVLDGTQLLTSLEKDLGVEGASALSIKSRVPVVNFMRRVSKGQRGELRQRLADWCRRHLEPVFDKAWYEVDALSALRHAVQGRGAPKDDFIALRRQLQALAGHDGEALRQDGRHRQLCQQLRVLYDDNLHELEALRSDADKVAAKRRDLRQQVGRDLRRLESCTEDLAENLALKADLLFDKRLRKLLDDKIDDASLHQLQSKASAWTQEAFQKAVAKLEPQADKALLDCTQGIDDLAPEPFTLTERLTLQGQVAMARQETIEAEPEDIAKSALVGGIIGSFLLPGVGTAAGAVAGGWLASIFGRQEPDPRPPLRKAIKKAWNASAADAEEQLESQVEQRVDDLKTRLQRRYEELAAAENEDGDDEIQCRQALKDTLQPLLQDLGDPA